MLAALAQLVALLRLAGIESVSIDPTKVNAPGAWVHAETLERDNLFGGHTVHILIDLVAPGYDTPTALATLTDLLDACLRVVAPDGPVQLDLAIELTSGHVLPGYRIPLDLTVPTLT